jgi:TctA family transporter
MLFLLGGMSVGLIIGIMPGIGSIVGLSVFLPFVFFLTPYQALPFMMGLVSVTFIGGSITTILLGIPGTTGNMPTLLDGFEMSKKGETGRAIGAAVTSSGMGSIYTAGFALLMVPLVIPLVMRITSADMVFFVLLGIMLIATLGRGSMLKGIISGLLGLVASLVGFHIVTGVTRFTFGIVYLYDGIPLVPVMLGLFALPAVMGLGVRGRSIAQEVTKIKGRQDTWQGVRDVFRHWKLNLRSSIIGYLIGIIPGVGASVSGWVAYGQAKLTSKHPELFGTGYVEGVIASESANDAKEGGALLTTLALGIPGSSIYVMFLGAFIMLGLVPGPRMLTENLELSLSLVIAIAFGSIIAALIALTAAPYLARVAYVPARLLVPLVLVVVFVGGFTSHRMFADLITIVIFGAIGLAMRKFGYNQPAFVLGFILGVLFEKYFFIALMAQGNLFFLRPIPLVIIAIILALFSFRPIKNRLQSLVKRGVQL